MGENGKRSVHWWLSGIVYLGVAGDATGGQTFIKGYLDAAAKYSCLSKSHIKQRIGDGVKTPLVDLEASTLHGHSLSLG